jgi:hypothetical protein
MRSAFPKQTLETMERFKEFAERQGKSSGAGAFDASSILSVAQGEGHVGSHSLNLAVRFLLEVVALVAIGYWGFSQHSGVWRFIIGIGGPIIAAIL